jgi:hypothetical protein
MFRAFMHDEPLAPRFNRNETNKTFVKYIAFIFAQIL